MYVSICQSISSNVKSLLIVVNWLALIGAIYSLISSFFTLNHIFVPAYEQAFLKYSNQLFV